MNSCVKTCTHQIYIAQWIVFFVVIFPELLCAAVFKYPWYATTKTSHLVGIAPHIPLLYNIDISVTNKGAMT